MSNLVLRRGRLYVMYKQYSSKEIFQVVLPQAAVKLRHNTVAMIGINGDMDADIQVKYGKADVLFGPSAAALEKRVVGKGLRAVVGAAHPFSFRPTKPTPISRLGTNPSTTISWSSIRA